MKQFANTILAIMFGVALFALTVDAQEKGQYSVLGISVGDDLNHAISKLQKFPQYEIIRNTNEKAVFLKEDDGNYVLAIGYEPSSLEIRVLDLGANLRIFRDSLPWLKMGTGYKQVKEQLISTGLHFDVLPGPISKLKVSLNDGNELELAFTPSEGEKRLFNAVLSKQ